MGQAAYDYNTARRRKVPQTQRKTALRVEKGGKRRLSPLQAALRNAMHLHGKDGYHDHICFPGCFRRRVKCRI